jgi:hypothetical protein
MTPRPPILRAQAQRLWLARGCPRIDLGNGSFAVPGDPAWLAARCAGDDPEDAADVLCVWMECGGLDEADREVTA